MSWMPKAQIRPMGKEDRKWEEIRTGVFAAFFASRSSVSSEPKQIGKWKESEILEAMFPRVSQPRGETASKWQTHHEAGEEGKGNNTEARENSLNNANGGGKAYCSRPVLCREVEKLHLAAGWCSSEKKGLQKFWS
jgi:hypothetical protein